jgi:signal peptidase I
MGKDGKGKKKSKLHEYVEIIVTAVILALIVRALIVQSYHIPSESMEDTLLKGDFLFANKFIYGAKVPFIDVHLPKVRDPKPGDIVIFKFPGDRKTDYIKRCIAVEGQTVELRSKRLFIDGIEKTESFPKYEDGGVHDFGPYKVPNGFILVFGDNRDNAARQGALPLLFARLREALDPLLEDRRYHSLTRNLASPLHAVLLTIAYRIPTFWGAIAVGLGECQAWLIITSYLQMK